MKRGNEAVDGDQREEHNARRSDRANETVEEAKRRKMERNRMHKDRRGNEDEQQSLVSAQMYCAGQLVFHILYMDGARLCLDPKHLLAAYLGPPK